MNAGLEFLLSQQRPRCSLSPDVLLVYHPCCLFGCLPSLWSVYTMDLSNIRDQVSNLTLYDIKAGVRKVQNGKHRSSH